MDITPPKRLRREALIWLIGLVSTAAAGMLYSYVAFNSAMLGALYAPFSIMPTILFERGMFLNRLRQWTASLSTPAYVLAKVLIFTALFIIGSRFASLLHWWIEGADPRITIRQHAPPWTAWLYSMAVALLLSAALRVRELLGRSIFTDIVLGRYRRPVEENRIFLYLDVTGSTSYAQRNGPTAAASYIGRIFKIMSEPVQDWGGAIDDYIGDAALVSWPLRDPLNGARCLQCAFDVIRKLDKHTPDTIRRFGQAPEVRILIHAGAVVRAEIGVDHHKISYFGDTINMVGKLEGEIKPLGPGIFVTEDALALAALPDHAEAAHCGEYEIKGLERAVVLKTLTSRARAATGRVQIGDAAAA
ncbi:adenylate/guanylate cyclase domain-containing protein [Rhizobium sp. FKL33]|uniref:adenylate/guanylate cyclase domain-containing protein n=1 Tax=Rhizobium sp. FKL33 TaxID=2562307 RepID=UPI001485A660|nr:adenylate/guanylate cyclase domain-containing protein [Rhizobium sp. FKL33]